MQTKNLLTASLLVVFAGLIGGCHYHAVDDYRGYGDSRGSYRDGRAYENRRDDWRDDGYRHRDRRDYR